ncbi:MAG: hypothetical protein JSW61_10025 [Candidatus Thorarchaeota archaeon]|nr:MAG: hypothetical protein JSW61_10025 [Candidatus Thorarchaeota archaeon]
MQTRLVDFDDMSQKKKKKTPQKPQKIKKKKPKTPRSQLWKKTIPKEEDWAVCNFDGTVLFVRLVAGRIHVHGTEAVCKWCESVLEIREDKVFCGGHCGKYQGEFSRDLDAYLHWEGAKSWTLRRQVAEAEGLQLEERDLEPMTYAPNWSILEEFEADDDEDS